MTTEDEMRSLIERYITAYNAFDVDGMLSAIHSDIDFQNISGGAITATASGIDEFRSLAEQSRSYFSSRRQTITNLAVDGQRASAEGRGVAQAGGPLGIRVPRRQDDPDY